MTEENSSVNDQRVKFVRGLPIPINPVHKIEYAEQSMDYYPRDGDVIVLAYPKTGSSWIHFIVWNILNKAQRNIRNLRELLIAETCGKEALDDLPEPRIYRTQLPVDRIQISSRAKYVYVHRNPADVMLSFHHFRKWNLDNNHDFYTFFKDFAIGNKLPFGNFFDHVLAAYKHKDVGNFLFVGYENAKKDPVGEVMRIAKFLGGQYYQAFLEDSSLAEKIVKLTSFDHMKQNIPTQYVAVQNSEKKDFYYRKGIVGEGKTSLTDEQRDALNEVIERKMMGTEFLDKWLV